MKKRDLPVLVINHQDLTWRRCFDRPLSHKGEDYASYAHLQKLYILENLRLCEKYPQYRFSIECVATLRHFLKNHPEHRDRIRELFDEGRLHMPFTGHNIVDSNLISGESIIRSYLFGYNYLKDNFGYRAQGFDRNDSFGNSAQLPQIARGFGINWTYNVVYTNLEGNYWKGLDGSVLAKVDPKQAAICGGYAKYRPCPLCHGKGDSSCAECHGTLIDAPFAEKRRFRISVDENDPQNDELQGYLYVSGEELLPTEEMFSWIEGHRDLYNIYFSNYPEIARKFYADRIAAADDPPKDELHPSPEVNFNNTGVYVSRIKAKQKVRKAESRIYAIEALSVMNSLMGKPLPSCDKEELWSDILFTMFHDAVTGTMVDAAYRELMDIHASIDTALSDLEAELLLPEKDDGTVTIVNPNGQDYNGEAEIPCPEGMAPFTREGSPLPVIRRNGDKVVALVRIPAFSTLICTLENRDDGKEYHKFAYAQRKGIAAVLRNDLDEEAADNTSEIFFIENEFYRITAESHGICEIFDKKAGCAVASEGQYKVGEWILEHDEGSPWTTLSTDMRRMPLSDVTFLVSFEKTEDYQRLTYSHTKKYWGYAVDAGYEIFYTVTLPRGEKKVLFEADVDWDTQNHRLRIAFPTPFKGRSIYEIPYGYIERAPYEPDIVRPHGPSNWAGAAGDCPAIGFAGVEGEGASLAILNRGTPSYQIAPDCDGRKTVFLSVLRSPSVGTYLHEPESYSMTDYDNMRDPGRHHFEYVLTSYTCPFDESAAVTDAASYNGKVYAVSGTFTLPEMPRISSDHVRISALKPACDGNGYVIRLCEYHGCCAYATLFVPNGITSVTETDLKEEPIRSLPIENGTVTLSFEPFKIKTLRFC